MRKLQVLDISENFGQGFRRGRRKMGCKNQNCTYTVRKLQISEKILVRASAGVDKNGLQKSKMYIYCARMRVLESRENFGQGFRRGRRKLGSKIKN